MLGCFRYFVLVLGCGRNDFHKRQSDVVPFSKVQQAGPVSSDRSFGCNIDYCHYIVSQSIYAIKHEPANLSVVQPVRYR